MAEIRDNTINRTGAVAGGLVGLISMAGIAILDPAFEQNSVRENISHFILPVLMYAGMGSLAGYFFCKYGHEASNFMENITQYFRSIGRED